MPRVTDAATATWTVLSFFVARPVRATGVARALLRGAVTYARGAGAAVIEGYPHDSAGVTCTHRGHSALLAAVGFRRDGPDAARWSRRLRPVK